jgi:hypothetical protein
MAPTAASTAPTDEMSDIPQLCIRQPEKARGRPPAGTRRTGAQIGISEAAGRVVNPIYVLVDLALCVLAVRSIGLLRSSSPWAALGWAFAFGYGAATAVEYALPPFHRIAAQIAYACLLAAAAAFIISAVKDERQGDPWWWPLRLGRTRAERARPGR